MNVLNPLGIEPMNITKYCVSSLQLFRQDVALYCSLLQLLLVCACWFGVKRLTWLLKNIQFLYLEKLSGCFCNDLDHYPFGL